MGHTLGIHFDLVGRAPYADSTQGDVACKHLVQHDAVAEHISLPAAGGCRGAGSSGLDPCLEGAVQA